MSITRKWTPELYPGEQIVYIPTHLQEKYDDVVDAIMDTDAERGFVTRVFQNGVIYCRYVMKHDHTILRTKANDEGAPVFCIWRLVWTTWCQINSWWIDYVTPSTELPVPQMVLTNCELEKETDRDEKTA